MSAFEWVRAKFGRRSGFPEFEVSAYEDIVEDVAGDEPPAERAEPGDASETTQPEAVATTQQAQIDPRAEFVRALRRQTLPPQTQALVRLLEGSAKFNE